MRIESVTFKRDENSPEEKGLLVVKTIAKEQVVISPSCMVIDSDCNEVKNLHYMKYNGRVALDYDTSLTDMGIAKNGVSGDVMSEVQYKIL